MRITNTETLYDVANNKHLARLTITSDKDKVYQVHVDRRGALSALSACFYRRDGYLTCTPLREGPTADALRQLIRRTAIESFFKN